MIRLKYFILLVVGIAFIWVRQDIAKYKIQFAAVKMCMDSYLKSREEFNAGLKESLFDSSYVGFLYINYIPTYVLDVNAKNNFCDISLFYNHENLQTRFYISDSTCLFQITKGLNYLYKKLESRKMVLSHIKE